MERRIPGDSPDHGSSPNAGVPPVKSRLATGLLLAFCCWHTVFLVISIMPAPPTGDVPGHPAMDLYRVAVGGQQLWTMFDTIPILHFLDVRLEREDETRRVTTAGCILPGFKPYPTPEKARYYNAFYRLLLADGKEAYRDAYLQKVAKLLPSHRSSEGGGNWILVVYREYTRHLFHSRRDGQLSMSAPVTFDLTESDSENP